ncbi:MAG: glycosyltransferase [Devosia sp.]
MSQRIVISVLGTHGDVQPYVALALTLQRRGFTPVICSTSDFATFVTDHGVEFHSLGSDLRTMLGQSKLGEPGKKNLLVSGPGLLRKGQRMLKEAGQRTWEAAQDADLLIFASTTTFCIDMAEALGIPAIMNSFQPLNPTGEFPYFQYEINPLEPLLYRFSRQPFGKVPSIDPLINKLSYVVQRAHQSYYDLPRDRLRRSLLGLRAKRRGGFVTNSHDDPITVMHAYSPTISPAPGDWPDTNIITGFWPLEDITGWQPDAGLTEFLAKGEAPVYLGFGSMPFGAQRNSEIISKAMKTWGGRAIIGKGWGGVKTEDLPDSVHVIDKVPHSELFKHVRAAVHHGGAGTTHTALMAGLPSFIVPQFFDQPYWGRLVYDLGAGPMPVRIRKLTPQILAAALEDLVSTPAYAKAAQAIAEKLALEDGTNRAVDVIEETLAAYHGPRDTARAELLGAAQ